MRLVLPSDKSEDKPDLCGLWVTLHAVYRQWALAREEAAEREDIADHLKRQLSELAAIPSDDWRTLLSLQGMTPLGLAALSWTQGATLEEGMRLWAQVQDQAADAPESALSGLRFVNPALLPAPAFSAFIEAGFTQQSQWRFLSLVFQGQRIETSHVVKLDPSISALFNGVQDQA